MSTIEKVLEALMGNKTELKFPGGEVRVEKISPDEMTDEDLLAKIDKIKDLEKKEYLENILWKREWKNIERQGRKDGSAFEFIKDSKKDISVHQRTWMFLEP